MNKEIFRKDFTEDLEKGKCFITSDLHFYHKNILNFCAKTRPFKDKQQMNEELIEEWNSKVGADDYIFHLGDLSFAGRRETIKILEKLNGKKIFILGNHDRHKKDHMQTLTTLTKDQCEQFNILFVGDYLEIFSGEDLITLCHYPMIVWNQSHRGSIQLFGHVHGTYDGIGRQVDVGYDRWGCIMNMNSIIEYCKEKEPFNPQYDE